MAPRILLAETDPTLLAMFAASLRAAGFQVLHASDGAATWELIETCAPAVVLMNVGLPGLSAGEILARLQTRQLTQRPPVILLGEDVPTEEMVQWFWLGADNYISKPFSTPVLVAQVRSLLRRVKV